MSDEIKNSTEEMVKKIEEKAIFEKKKEEVQAKELKIRERRVDNEIEKMLERDKNAELSKTISYGEMADSELEKIQKDNTEYILAARNKMIFINEAFDRIIPFFRKNLILIGSETGYGKSTTVANIARETIKRMDETTKKRRRALIITNEEQPEDVYNRITCLVHGWPYTEHDKFTDEQIAEFNRYIKALSSNGMITVIHDTYGGASGTTTTLEGICQIFDNLIANKDWYDVVILDYYQKVQESRKNPGMNEWAVQAALANRLDGYKNVYPAPIVVFAQLKPSDEENTAPFKTRIEGRKAILNTATCCVEIIPNREESTTEWHIYKNRFCGESVGNYITTGYEKGRYVIWSDEFKDRISQMKAAREQAGLDRAINPMPAMPADEEPNGK